MNNRFESTRFAGVEQVSTNVIPFRRRPRRKLSTTFCFNSMRRREIEAHAKYVGAADTDDFARWLVAWLWHLPKSADRIGALINAAFRMGHRGATETEVAEIIDEADNTPPYRSADKLAHWLHVTYRERSAIGLTTIGSIDIGKRTRRALRKRRDRLAAERRRRAAGRIPRAKYEADSTAAKIRASGVSKATFYRRKKAADQALNVSRETGVSSAESFYGADTRVSGTRGRAAEQTMSQGRADANGTRGGKARVVSPRWLSMKWDDTFEWESVS